jgi:2'-5' RNA ligase
VLLSSGGRQEVSDAPLVLTLAFDAPSFERFDALRREHFPPGRNIVPAHLTLFHALPGAEEPAILADLAAVCQGREAPLHLAVTGLRFLGKGVAYVLASPELVTLRADLAGRWAAWLTPQDRQPFRPHVTVQNKAAPEAARALHERLSASFVPFEVATAGLLLWRYLGGPWEEVARVPFRSP